MEKNVEKNKIMRILRQPTPTEMADQNQLENVEYFSYVCSVITYDARCIHEIKSKISMAKAALNKKQALFTSKLDLNLRKKLLKCYTWNAALYGAKTWTLRYVDQKHLKNF